MYETKNQMRTMILSFSPEWYPYLKSGEKIFEHRKRICKEPVEAYIYLGLPYREIVAKIVMGERENISEWLDKYSYDKKAIERIQDCLTRNNYAKPILSYQEIYPIDVKKMEKELDAFRVPISYMFIDDRPDILNYIRDHETNISKEITHDFCNLSSDKICTC